MWELNEWFITIRSTDEQPSLPLREGIYFCCWLLVLLTVNCGLWREREREMMKMAPLVPLALALALALLLLQLQLIVSREVIQSNDKELTPVPTPWPDRFRALLYMNLSSTRLQITDLWYDWPKGRNVNIMQKQLGELLYDVEWNNGTSFYYTQGGGGGHCSIRLFGVGIPRPNWLVDGAIYLGTEYTDGFLCNVWKKVDFIWYYEDVVTKIPVRWDFYDGISTHVITYEVGAELDDSQVQAPGYCFSQKTDQQVHESQTGPLQQQQHMIKEEAAEVLNPSQ